MLERFTSPSLLGWRRSWYIGQRRFGFEKSEVVHHGDKYLTRWILYFGFGTLRLHKFWRGDDDRAPHTHPWWFITFPLRSYAEWYFLRGHRIGLQVVKRFRFYFRDADYEHIVVCPVKTEDGRNWFNAYPDRVIYTIVLTGERTNGWGFYPEPDKFVPWREFVKTYEDNPT